MISIQIKNDITLRLVKKNACKDTILEIAAFPTLLVTIFLPPKGTDLRFSPTGQSLSANGLYRSFGVKAYF